jgi:hypothetical protein
MRPFLEHDEGNAAAKASYNRRTREIPIIEDQPVNRDDISRLHKVVLVFPCGSEICLEIHRALRISRHVELVGASSVPSNHGKYVFKNYVEGLPFVDEPTFIEKLNETIETNRIDYVFPAHDSVVLTLAQRADSLLCGLVGSPAATCEVCRNKRVTYELFSSKLRVPKVFSYPEEMPPFPVFLKPEVGQGSRGTNRASSEEEMRFFIGSDPNLLILEYLPGEEYTVDCFTDRHGELRFAGARKRTRMVSGISADTSPVYGNEFREIAKIINSTLVFRGAWFFQVKRDAEGELVLMEIAPRVSGSMGLYRNLGVNFPLLSIFDSMESDVEILCNKHHLVMDRALGCRFDTDIQYENVYIDLDDTILLGDRVNPMAVAFLYQCRNKGIGIHLISRSVDDIGESLRRHALDSLFDSLIHISDERPKSGFISAPNAIFIDDSFAERREVSEKLGIPTFAVEALESLIEEFM